MTVPPDTIRALFSRAMSRMYQAEVPPYGALTTLVAEVNAEVLDDDPARRRRLEDGGELARLNLERHGAIRLGSAPELGTLRRLFAVMGMAPVGFYDLSVAGVPVQSTAFRPVDAAALKTNPFRVFTSLLRLELIPDEALREEAAVILARRSIFTPACLELVARAERAGGLGDADAERLVAEALETFRWRRDATVPVATYERLRRAHPVIADVVSFRGVHINHLTPRTLDIDAVQARMAADGLQAKAVIEGPPRRRVPILLRQTSFKALEEPVVFPEADGGSAPGLHAARFGEIEQRGAALTPKGRALYDRLLAETQAAGEPDYAAALVRRFSIFPDDEQALRRQGLAYFRYTAAGAGMDAPPADLEAQLDLGLVRAEPIIYEDFLPVSAAGIFQSNLGPGGQGAFAANPNRAAFEQALGVPVIDPDALYAREEADSLAVARATVAGSAHSPAEASIVPA